MCNDFLPWKTLCRHYGRNNESVNAGLSKFQGLAARNVEIGVHMQTQPFNKHGISAELKKKNHILRERNVKGKQTPKSGTVRKSLESVGKMQHAHIKHLFFFLSSLF